MDLIKVKSAAIRAIGYKGRSQVLQILFAGGTLKTYRGIEAQVWQSLMAAESKGRWFRGWQKQRKDQRQQRNG